MSDRPLLFISAVSAEHRSLRTTVAALLDHEGYDTDFQDVFGTEHGDITDMLARRVDQCDGVIQLIGQRYGFAPPAPHPQFGECSYTQFEALYARSLGRTVRYILLDPAHPTDGPTKPDPVPATGSDPAALQRAYRQRVEKDTALWHASKSIAETENCIYRLRPVLEELRKEWRERIERLEGKLGDTASATQRTEGKVDDMKAMLQRLLDAQSAKAKEASAEGKTLADFTDSELLADYARRIGQSPETVRAVLAEALTSPDLSTRAQAVMIEQQFAEAAKLSRQAGDEKAARLRAMQARAAALAEDAAHDYCREGVAHYYQLNYLPGIAAYEKALAQITPTSCAETWGLLQNNLAAALLDYGMRTEPGEGKAYLGRAVAACQSALEVCTREALPLVWALTMDRLGSALSEQGVRSEGQEGLDLLGQAVSAHRSALDIYTRAALPEDWAATQNNLAVALKAQGQRTKGKAGFRLLGEAISAFRSALEVRSGDIHSGKWEMTQSNLGAALRDKGIRTEGHAGVKLLEEAVSAFRSALKVNMRRTQPEQWAAIHNNLANALSAQARRSDAQVATELLEQAVISYRFALTVRTREALPQKWAMTQSNLASVLAEQGSRREGAPGLELLSQALEAYSLAMEVSTRETSPQEWAGIQCSRAIVMVARGDKAVGSKRKQFYREAERTFGLAHEVFTKKTHSHYYYVVEQNLAHLQAKMAK